MASNLYNYGLLNLVNGNISYLTDSLFLLLVSPSYTFNKNHQFVSEVVSHEVTNSIGTGYERKPLVNKTINVDDINNKIIFNADDPFYSLIDTNENLSKLIIFKLITDDNDSKLISCIDFPDLVTNGSNVILNVNSNGLFEIENILV